MKSMQTVALCLVMCAMLAGNAHARDTKRMYAIADALDSSHAQGITSDIQLFFGEQSHPSVARRFGNFMSNKKSSGIGRSDSSVCYRAFASAMLQFQERARREGGNAVVNLTSYYKKNHISSTTEFECGSGAVMSGVTFRGDVVRLD